MKWVITFLFSCLVLLAVAVMLSACTGTVAHKSRQLTCFGFCSDTGVEHNNKKTEEPVKDEK